jgi:uncharacterized membrane protein
MVKSRLIRLVFSVALVVFLMGGFVLASTAAFAADPTPTPTDTTTPTATPTPTPTSSPASGAQPTLTLDSTYPVLTNDSGQTFTYTVNIHYAGFDKKTFDLNITAPPGWTANVTAGYPVSQISAIQIIPTDINTPSTQSVTVNAIPDQGNLPEPGNYTTTLKVSSGSLSQSIDLKAVVKAKYSFVMTTPTGNLATQATAGNENHFSFTVTNTGSAPIDKVNFTSTNPSGWVVTFKPNNIDSLGASQTQQIDAVITPPQGKTIAGDYIINFKADTGTISQTLDVRVTVATPTIWGWLSLIIIAVVIVGLAVLFMKLGRR